MLNRIILFVVVLASLVWIAFIGFDILNNNDTYEQSALFGVNDEKILIINRTDEIDLQRFQEFSNSPASELFNVLNPELIESAVLSAKQDHLMIKGKEHWTKELLNSLLINNEFEVKIDEESFIIGRYTGRYQQDDLYISSGNIILPQQNNADFSYDKKASASLIHFDENSDVQSISDIYLRSDNRIDYVTHNSNIPQGNQVNDEDIFANIVTKNFSSYHFLERDYAALGDSVFANGPMFSWMQNGFVILEYEGAKAIISDYVGGQDPILTLNDLSQTHDTNRFSIPLTQSFPTRNKSYTVKYLEDLVVIAESSEICDKIIADLRLGQTISLNNGVRHRLYGMLPKSVSERMVSSELAYTKTAYQGRLLETKLDFNSISIPETTADRKSITMNCGYTISDILVLPNTGNVIVSGSKGEVSRFKNGKLSWSKNTDRPALGDLQLIDLYQTGENYLLLNTKDKIYCWDLEGRSISGFPIDLEDDAKNQVKFYRWNGRSYFLIAVDGNKVIHFDGKGRELNIIKTSIPINRQIDVWASQHKLFAGFANDSKFIMYNMDEKHMHREFDLPSKSFSLKVPNELFQFGIENNTLTKISQKGVRMNYASFTQPTILSIEKDNNNNAIIVQDANRVKIFNDQGIPFGEISLSFNEIAHVFMYTGNSGKTTVAIIDGLENNVYLYELDGKLIKDGTIEGQSKVVLTSSRGQQIVTTITDEFVVQYLR